MQQSPFEETRAIAHLANLDIEIVHGRAPDGTSEHLSIHLRAMPSFEAFGRGIEAANPFLFWVRFAQTAWAPWLPAPWPGSSAALLPPKNIPSLPATPNRAGPDSTA
jgi:hypothetical protein